MPSVQVGLHKPHRGQEAAEVALDASRFVSVMCGRRWGKTLWGVSLAARRALNGERVGWFAPTYKLASEAWRELVTTLRPVASHVSEQDKRLEVLGGGTIEVWTLDVPDPARGRKYHLVIVDEAGMVRGLMLLWQAAIRPTLTDYRGKAVFLGTPKGASGDFVRLHRGAGGKDTWRAVSGKTVDNPYIDVAEVEDARAELPPAIFAQEYEGVPMDEGSRPFTDAALEKVTAPAEDHPVSCWGVDLGSAHSWTVAIGMGWNGRWVKVDRFRLPWPETKARLVRLLGATPALVDCTGVGAPVVEDLALAGCAVEGFRFTDHAKRDLLGRLAMWVQSAEGTLPPEAVREMALVEYVTGDNGVVRYSSPDDAHDDAVMAAGLAVRAWDKVSRFAKQEAVALPYDAKQDTTDWREIADEVDGAESDGDGGQFLW